MGQAKVDLTPAGESQDGVCCGVLAPRFLVQPCPTGVRRMFKGGRQVGRATVDLTLEGVVCCGVFAPPWLWCGKGLPAEVEGRGQMGQTTVDLTLKGLVCCGTVETGFSGPDSKGKA